MKISKSISALILSLVLVLGSFGTAHAKRLTAAVADWTGGEITCQVAVSMLEEELGYKVKRVVFPSGTGLWEAIAAGEIDFACESWPSYAEADTVMMKGPLIYDGQTMFNYEGDGSVKLLGTSGIIGLSDYYIPRYAAESLGINFFSKTLLCGSGPDTNTKSCFFVIVLKYLNLDRLDRY